MVWAIDTCYSAWYGVWQGMAWHGTVYDVVYGMAWHGMAWYGVWCCTDRGY